MTPNNRASGATILATGAVAALAVCTCTNGQQFQDQQSTRFPQPPLLEYTNQCSIADVDGDIDLDIAWANGGGFPSAGPDQQVRLFINNGSGVFSDQSIARIGVLLGDFRGVEFGDVERDGDLDMALANDNNALPRLLINNGSGFFTDGTAARLPNLTLGSSRVQFGDVDNDLDLDLYFTNGTTSRFGSGRGKLYLNNGLGFYTDATLTNTPNQNVTEPQDCIFGDIDGDFDLDIRIGSTASNQSKLYRNNGFGMFTVVSGVPADNNCYSYDFGDINGDGDLDLLGANAHPTMANSEFLLQNNGAGGYSSLPFTGAATDDNDSKFFDYDNDGDRDIVIASLGSTERAYSNNGAGTFALAAGIFQAIGDASLDIKVADFNGDNRYDIVTAQGESGNFTDRIYMNVTGPVDTLPPAIVKTEEVADTDNPAGPYHVRAVVHDAHTSDRGFHDKGVFLNYSANAGPVQQVEMDWVGNSIWRGSIPGPFAVDDKVSYFVTAKDFANNTGTGPSQAFLILHPPCPADINGDVVVNVDDLLAVINAWGQASVTHEVAVADFEFIPALTSAKAGDSVHWAWDSGAHTVTSGTACTANGTFNATITSSVPNFTYVIPSDFSGAIPYYCIPHCAGGMVGDVTVTPWPANINDDDTVDVDDLLAVINAWGPCP